MGASKVTTTITPNNGTGFEQLIWVDPERMSGVPCFYGTRIPIKNLFDYLEGGESLQTFLEDFEGASHAQATGVLRLAMQSLLEHPKQS